MTGMWVGIDVSKAWLDVQIEREEGGLRVRNDAAGHAGLIARLDGATIAGVVLEASGGYERPVQAALNAARLAVALVTRRGCATSQGPPGGLAKTDRIDARVLAAEPVLGRPFGPTRGGVSEAGAEPLARNRAGAAARAARLSPAARP